MIIEWIRKRKYKADDLCFFCLERFNLMTFFFIIYSSFSLLMFFVIKVFVIIFISFKCKKINNALDIFVSPHTHCPLNRKATTYFNLKAWIYYLYLFFLNFIAGAFYSEKEYRGGGGLTMVCIWSLMIYWNHFYLW